MDTLFAKQNRLLTITPTKMVRGIMNVINWDAHLIAIRGARGIGKTTVMLQYIKQNYEAGSTEALYCSLDSMYFSNHSLTGLGEEFYKMGGKHLFLDEIHKYPTWSREVKELYDLYPDMKIVITGSSLLNILNGDADLSRRCIPYMMQGLSFREYLQFYHNIEISPRTLDEILANPTDICSEVNSKCRPLPLFKSYLQYGYFPYYKQNHADYYVSIEQVINFVIETELPQLCNVDPGNIRKIKALLSVLGSSVPFEVDIAKLSTAIGIHRNTTIGYLLHLERAGLLTLLYSDLMSVKRMQKPDKVYLDNPNMIYALASTTDIKIGTVRETFAVNQLTYQHDVEYSKQAGDFKIDGTYLFEVGGADKTFRQIADMPKSYILADDIELPIGKKLPLWLMGFLY